MLSVRPDEHDRVVLPAYMAVVLTDPCPPALVELQHLVGAPLQATEAIASDWMQYYSWKAGVQIFSMKVRVDTGK